MFKCTAAPKPKNIRKIIVDGNCLFRAFFFCLTGSEEHYLTTAACALLASAEHWGTEIEIPAFTDMCNCMVYVYKDHDSARNIKQYEGYGPRPRADRSPHDNADLTTFLLYNAHNHFEVVLSP
uniref:OTU domain-containing protein n=1 Tax=Plectus sambesii TaxID=2011161 RepID=A0A914XD44_9BILA